MIKLLSTIVDLSDTWKPDGWSNPNFVLSKILLLPSVTGAKKLPLADGIRETYHWKVTHVPGAEKRIDEIVKFYRREGNRFRGDVVKRFKTGGHYYVHVILSCTQKVLLDDICDTWKSSGWANVRQSDATGWISAIASKQR